MVSKLIVYSCITSGFDAAHRTLLRGEALQQEEDVRYILFSDTLQPCSMSTGGMTWEVQNIRWSHSLCPRRTARYHKCLPHVVLPPHQKSLWVDGNFAFKSINPLVDIANVYLADGFNIATYRHRDRQCVYQEERACLRFRKDQAHILRKQLSSYQSEGYPTYNGLAETGCLVRHNNVTMQEFNDTWWSEIERHSFRDQISFPYVCWKLGVRYGHIEGDRGNIWKSQFFHYIKHPRQR